MDRRNLPSVQPEDAEFGATRRLIMGAAGGAKKRGDPWIHRWRSPRDVRLEATRRPIRRPSLKMQGSRQLEAAWEG